MKQRMELEAQEIAAHIVPRISKTLESLCLIGNSITGTAQLSLGFLGCLEFQTDELFATNFRLLFLHILVLNRRKN